MKTIIFFLALRWFAYIDHTPSLEQVYNPIERAPNVIVVPAVINIPGLLPAIPAINAPNPILFQPLVPEINL